MSTPKATDYIEEMQDLIKKIIKNGYGYIADGSVYLDVQKYRQDYKYGQLVSLDFEAQVSTKRVENDEYKKEDIADFVLWKGKKEGEPFWDFSVDTSTGSVDNLPGRPGWHIECSAMSKSLFPDFPFDIHIGGIDLCFPHHEDEICQSRAGYEVDTAHHWMHNEHLMVEGKKMSKSLGNFYTLADLEKKGFSGEVVRLFLATSHYRTKINLSDDSLAASAKMLERIRNFIRLALSRGASCGDADKQGQAPTKTFLQKFSTAMKDDLNVSVASAEFFEFVQTSAQKGFSEEETVEFIKTVKYVESVFGIRFLQKKESIPKKFLLLLEERNRARDEKNWKKSDEIRDVLTQAGYTIRDGKNGAKLLQI